MNNEDLKIRVQNARNKVNAIVDRIGDLQTQNRKEQQKLATVTPPRSKNDENLAIRLKQVQKNILRDAALHNFCYAFMTTIRTLSRSVEDMEAVWAAPQPLAPLSAALLRKL